MNASERCGTGSIRRDESEAEGIIFPVVGRELLICQAFICDQGSIQDALILINLHYELHNDDGAAKSHKLPGRVEEHLRRRKSTPMIDFRLRKGDSYEGWERGSKWSSFRACGQALSALCCLMDDMPTMLHDALS